MKISSYPTRWFAICLCALLVVACARSPVTQFYVLDGGEGASIKAGSQVSPRPSQELVYLAPISLPPSIDRAEIIVHTNEYNAEVLEHARWLGDLSGQLQQLLATSIGQQQAGVAVIAKPRHLIAREFPRLVISFERLRIDEATMVVAHATWEYRVAADAAPVIGHFENTEPLADGAVSTAVAALARSVRRLSAAIGERAFAAGARVTEF